MRYLYPLRVIFSLLFFINDIQCGLVWAKGPVPLPGTRAVVIDERHSAVRDRPDLQGALRQRLRRGRVVGLLGSVKNRRGERFYRVAISRHRVGWIFEAAIVRAGQPRDAQRLRELLDATTDDFVRLRLAGIWQREFRRHPDAAEVAEIAAAAGERLAARLTRDIQRRVDESVPARRRALFLNHPSLDRFNRLGILFDYDEASDSLVQRRR